MNILITGASSGIGKELAISYAGRGHQVTACGRNQVRLDNLSSLYPNICSLVFDVTDKAQVAEAGAHLSDIDLLILNAGDCEYIDQPLQFNADLFQRVIQTNLISVAYCLQSYLPKMKRASRLVFISSSVTYLPLSKAQAYGASKAGLSYLAKSLAVDLLPLNIKVTLVEPGFVKTPLTDKNQFDMPFLMSAQRAADKIVLGIDQQKSLIRFPTIFIFLLKLINLLPLKLQNKLLNNKSKASK